MRWRFDVLLLTASCVLSIAYLVLRYSGRNGLATPLVAASVFALAAMAVYALCSTTDRRRGLIAWRLVGIVCTVPCLILFCEALSRHIWRGLVCLESLDSLRPPYLCWDSAGRTRVVPDTFPLENFHRGGDETAHLAAAMAMRKSWGMPSGISEMVGEPQGHDRSYWLRRALTGHPPGLAMIYAPVAENPPLARVWAGLVFLACIAAAFWAGNQWSPETRFGLLAAATFASIPNLDWWHAVSVSSDIPPCFFCFLAFGLLARATKPNGYDVKEDAPIRLAGLVLGVGCLVTLTASLASLAAAMLVGVIGGRRRIGHALWLVIPSVLCVVAGMAYSKLAVPVSQHPVLARLDLAPISGVRTFTGPLVGLLTFVRRWPMDLGIPLTLLFALLPVRQMIRLGDPQSRRWVLGGLLAAGAVLVPSAIMFWPEIRFAFPGFLGVLLGLGFLDYWKELSPRLRAATVATIVAFAYSKFVLHNLLVVG